jgi:hypothetical protein
MGCPTRREIKAHDRAEASLQQAEWDSKRVSSLFNQQAVTRASMRLPIPVTWLKGSCQRIMGLRRSLRLDGVVTRKWVDVGDQAAPGKPLVDIEDPSTFGRGRCARSHCLQNKGMPA